MVLDARMIPNQTNTVCMADIFVLLNLIMHGGGKIEGTSGSASQTQSACIHRLIVPDSLCLVQRRTLSHCLKMEFDSFGTLPLRDWLKEKETVIKEEL